MKPIEKWTDFDTYTLYCLYGIIPDDLSHIKKENLIDVMLKGKCPCGCGLEIPSSSK